MVLNCRRKLGLRKVKWLFFSHSIPLGQSWDPTPECPHTRVFFSVCFFLTAFQPPSLFLPRATLRWWSSSLAFLPLVHFPSFLHLPFVWEFTFCCLLFFFFFAVGRGALFLIVVFPFPFPSSWFSLMCHLASFHLTFFACSLYLITD